MARPNGAWALILIQIPKLVNANIMRFFFLNSSLVPSAMVAHHQLKGGGKVLPSYLGQQMLVIETTN